MNQKRVRMDLRRLKSVYLLAPLVASTCLAAGTSAEARMMCGRHGSINWRVNGKMIYEYYKASDFKQKSSLVISQPKKTTVNGITSRKNGGAIIFLDNNGRYIVHLKLKGIGEGYTASLIDNGESTACGLY